MIQVNNEDIQRRLEAEIGSLVVQNLIKESTITRQNQELIRLREQLAAIGRDQAQRNLGPDRMAHASIPVRKPDDNQGGI